MVCEAPPAGKRDGFYSGVDSMYVTNTVMAFKSAGIEVQGIPGILDVGVLLTTAVKEPKEGNVIPAAVIKEHSFALEAEIGALPNLRAILLMGDAAIKSLNYIARRRQGVRAIPAGSTYKIREGEFSFEGSRVFPSYLQTGKNFLIEKSKQRMVAEDIRNAFLVVEGRPPAGGV